MSTDDMLRQLLERTARMEAMLGAIVPQLADHEQQIRQLRTAHDRAAGAGILGRTVVSAGWAALAVVVSVVVAAWTEGAF